MTTLVILFIVSAILVLGGLGFIKEIYEEVNDRFAMKPSDRVKFGVMVILQDKKCI